MVNVMELMENMDNLQAGDICPDYGASYKSTYYNVWKIISKDIC